MSNPVSFKITRDPQTSTSSSNSRPRPQASQQQQGSRHHQHRHHHSRYASETESDSDDDDRAFNRRDKGKGRAEAITSIDKHGVRLVHPQPCYGTALHDSNMCLSLPLDLPHSSANEAPKQKALVIPSQPNKDFRKAALELRAAKKGLSFLPGAANGANGEVVDKNGRKRELTEEELAFLKSGTNVQRIGTGVVTGGIRERPTNRNAETPVPESNADGQASEQEGGADGQASMAAEAKEEVSEDALALRELLAANSDEPTGPKVHIIPQAQDVVSEQDAYAHDIASRPDSATLEDYERVPIEDFGAALLRGMGGGNKPRKVTQAYVPKPRTALLGIGAKSREETFGKDFVLASNGGKKETKRDGMKFIPLARVERPSSGSASPAPLPPNEDPRASSSRKGRADERYDSSSRRSDRDRYKDDDRYSRKRREDDYRDELDDKKSKKRRDDEPVSDDDGSRRHRRRERSRSRSPGRSSRKDRDDRDRKYRERSRSRERSSYKGKDGESDRRDRHRSERSGRE